MFASLTSLQVARFRFTIEPTEEIRLSEYKGSAFRGGFGYAFKRVTCITRDRFCEPCILKSSCSYYRVFESKVSSETAERLRLGSDAPHPFVIEPPLTEQCYFQPGDRLTFSLVLIGSAVGQLPFFVYAFMIFGESFGIGKGRGRFRLLEVEDENGKQLFDNGNLSGGFVIRSAGKIMGLGDSSIERSITLRFETPLRMKTAYGREKKELVTRMGDHASVRVLLKSLYHRAFVLNHLYGKGVKKESYDSRNLQLIDGDVDVVRADTFWYDWERYSQRQQRRMRLGGIMGEVTLGGKVAQYEPLLRLGEYLHVGKSTGFGLGKYRIVEEETKCQKTEGSFFTSVING
ncbi:MAG: CRISPR system precrRNA processing endoribonuclease RAMP protein Cas6 [Chlorobiales bacterium]|nr:CRISPR system precrRNA processing endoribonuclease RAMP protein Cas6 [Chlorobiales bacterium]